MSMKHWWDDTDRKTNLSTRGGGHFFYHKSYMEWFLIEPTPG